MFFLKSKPGYLPPLLQPFQFFPHCPQDGNQNFESSSVLTSLSSLALAVFSPLCPTLHMLDLVLRLPSPFPIVHTLFMKPGTLAPLLPCHEVS